VAEVLADPGLAPVLGLREAGSILPARVAAQEEDGLTRLETAGGPVWLPRIEAAVGSAVRVRIAAQDVIIARARPEGISALNVLPAVVTAVRMGDGPGALVRLSVGGSAEVSVGSGEMSKDRASGGHLDDMGPWTSADLVLRNGRCIAFAPVRCGRPEEGNT
jgi:ABC-type molybdate transport system ATPase subunit